MRSIAKGTEPTSLAQHRATAHSNYENYKDKEQLRHNLSTEQRGLCCYCLSSIGPSHQRMKIEHWHSQDMYPNEQLNYSNLLGACLGNEGQAVIDQTCDTHKGNRELSRNPANPLIRIEDLIDYGSNGKISSTNIAFDMELNEILNLNAPSLISSRKEVLKAFKTLVEKRGTLSRATWSRLLQEWNGESNTNNLRPFCNVIVYWISKQLR
jgi:uncharacterized protein (TIGR02646 family)